LEGGFVERENGERHRAIARAPIPRGDLGGGKCARARRHAADAVVEKDRLARDGREFVHWLALLSARFLACHFPTRFARFPQVAAPFPAGLACVLGPREGKAKRSDARPRFWLGG